MRYLRNHKNNLNKEVIRHIKIFFPFLFHSLRAMAFALVSRRATPFTRMTLRDFCKLKLIQSWRASKWPMMTRNTGPTRFNFRAKRTDSSSSSSSNANPVYCIDINFLPLTDIWSALDGWHNYYSSNIILKIGQINHIYISSKADGLGKLKYNTYCLHCYSVSTFLPTLVFSGTNSVVVYLEKLEVSDDGCQSHRENAVI